MCCRMSQPPFRRASVRRSDVNHVNVSSQAELSVGDKCKAPSCKVIREVDVGGAPLSVEATAA